MAADFFGTCQICGRQQKAHPHRIAKHGYTIRYGWQMGECFGSGAKPYEISNDRIMDAIESAKRYIVQTRDQIAALQADPFEKDGMVFAEVSDQRYGDTRMAMVKLTITDKGQVEAKDSYDRRVFVRMSGNNGYVKSVEEAARAVVASRIGKMEVSISQTEEAIPYMQARYDNWKPAELKPVTDADRAATKIKIHMAATKFGRKTSICVHSASAAQAYKATTDDRAKVTCAACLKELARLDELPRLKAEQAEKERLKGIKDAERDIKLNTKYLKAATADSDKLYYAQELTRATNTLNDLRAKAPAAQ